MRLIVHVLTCLMIFNACAGTDAYRPREMQAEMEAHNNEQEKNLWGFAFAKGHESRDLPFQLAFFTALAATSAVVDHIAKERAILQGKHSEILAVNRLAGMSLCFSGFDCSFMALDSKIVLTNGRFVTTPNGETILQLRLQLPERSDQKLRLRFLDRQ